MPGRKIGGRSAQERAGALRVMIQTLTEAKKKQNLLSEHSTTELQPQDWVGAGRNRTLGISQMR